MKNIICILLAMLGLMACKEKQAQKASGDTPIDAIDQQSVQKIDVHSHFHHSRDYLPAFFKKWNMQSVLVDVAIEDSTDIRRSWNEYLTQAKAYPDLFFLCSSLIGTDIDAPDFAKKAIERLGQEIDSGAIMVKVWKNFGMVTKDASGKFIQIDDPRLKPIWDFLKESSIPVMAHIGEPVQAWRPLDDPNNPHYGYYSRHPEYHAYAHTEIPSYETIISARDRWIENNPDLKILCAHMGSMSHDVNMIAERLDKFPNMYVEPAARFGDLAKQDSKKVRAFFEKYQDRVLFGTDYNNETSENELTATELKDEQTELDASYERLWRYLATSDSLEIRNQKTMGLALPKEILDKVYYENATDFLKLK